MKIPKDCINCIGEHICPPIVIKGDSDCRKFQKALGKTIDNNENIQSLCEKCCNTSTCATRIAMGMRAIKCDDYIESVNYEEEKCTRHKSSGFLNYMGAHYTCEKCGADMEDCD